MFVLKDNFHGGGTLIFSENFKSDYVARILEIKFRRGQTVLGYKEIVWLGTGE